MCRYQPADHQSTLLRIDVGGDADRREVVLRGELDMSTAGHLRDVLHACAVAGARSTVVDMTALDFLSVAGVNVLLDARDCLSRSGGRLVLAEPSTCAIRILRALRLDEMLAVVDEPARLMTPESSDLVAFP